jgi:hypothetical protein
MPRTSRLANPTERNIIRSQLLEGVVKDEVPAHRALQNLLLDLLILGESINDEWVVPS